MQKKTAIKVGIFALLGVLCIGGLVALIIHYFSAKTFYFFYISGIALYVVSVLVFALVMRKTRVGQVTLIRLREPDADSSWARVRGYSRTFFAEIHSALCWPLALKEFFRVAIAVVVRRGKWSDADTLRHQQSASFVFDSQLYRALFAILLFSLARQPSFYLARLAFLIASATAISHVTLIVSTRGMLEELKQTKGNPAIKLALITCLDLTTLTLSLSTIQGHILRTGTGLANLKVILSQLLSAPKTAALYLSGNLANNAHNLAKTAHADQLALLFGLLMYAALLRAVVSKGTESLRRTDEDYHVLAARLVSKNETQPALKILEKIKLPSWETHSIKSKALLIEGHIEQAKISAMRDLHNNPKVSLEPTVDDAYYRMFSIWISLPEKSRARLREAAEKEKLSEAVRLWICWSVEQVGAFEHESTRLTDPVISTPYITILDNAGKKKFQEALDELNSLNVTNPSDQFLKMTFDFVFHYQSLEDTDERNEYVKTWLSQNREPYDEVCASISQQLTWAQLLVLLFVGRVEEFAKPVDEDAGVWLDGIYQTHLRDLSRKPDGQYYLAALGKTSLTT